MTDGVRDSGRRDKEKEQSSSISKRKCSTSSSGGNDFAHAISKIAVAQICESLGFQSFQQSTLDKFADIATRYIYHVGKNAHSYTNLSNRVQGNLFDIVQGLEDSELAQGFTGASDVYHCLASSGVVSDLIRYVNESESPPFAYSIPSFPHVKNREKRPSFLQIAEEPPGNHIPAWLPAFPKPQVSAENERVIEKVGPSLNMQQRFSFNEFEGPSSNNGDTNKGKQATETNPFLTAPLRPEDVNVLPLTIPTKLASEETDNHIVVEDCAVVKHVSVMDTFTPAIEAMKRKLCDNDDEGRETGILDQRPAVQFKFKSGKMSSPQNKGFQKIMPLFGNDNDKNDQQRRAEKIWKDSMNNTQELA
ncbi:hypothetical protein ACFE04_010453 [Oxalis oulophora]